LRRKNRKKDVISLVIGRSMGGNRKVGTSNAFYAWVPHGFSLVGGERVQRGEKDEGEEGKSGYYKTKMTTNDKVELTNVKSNASR